MALRARERLARRAPAEAHRLSGEDEHTPRPVRDIGCCIVGAGPAGAMLALLLARQGIGVVLLEAHADFERDFRGDTLHPSTLELMDELGLVDRLLEIPHGTIERFMLHTPAGVVPFRAPGAPGSKYPHLLQLPQARFLELVIGEAQRYPSFQLVLGARVEELIQERGVFLGVRYRDQSGSHELRARLIVGADGRHSKVRQLVGFEPAGNAQPMDVLWFRLPRLATDPADADGIYAGNEQVMVMLRKADAWQIAYWIPKGGYGEVRQAGREELGRSVTALAPWLGDRGAALPEWRQMAVLTVESSRLRRWYRPGVLLIGDAAHVMSPVGGVGVNLAIQDAVAAANVLGPRLKDPSSEVRTRDLAAVQRRREWSTRIIQFLQDMTLRQVLAASGAGGTAPARPPLAARLARRLPAIAAFRDRLFANGGFRPERVRPRTGWMRTAFALVALVCGAACGVPAPSAGSTPPSTAALKVSDPSNVAGAPIYVALDEGYFKLEGLDVELVSMTPNEVVQSVATGQVQFGMTLPSPSLFNALERGIEVKIVASAIINQANDRPAAFMVRSDLIESGTYTSAKDLRGTTIAAAPDASQFYIERFLHQAGLTRDDVRFENLSELSEVLAAFSSRSIAAAWLPEPFVTAAERQGLARTVATTGQLFPGAATQTLVMAPTLGQDQPDVAQRFVRAYLRGVRAYYHAITKGDTDREPVVRALVNHTPIKDPRVYSVMGLPSMDRNARVDLTSWNVFQDYFVERGLQKHKLDLSPYVETSLLDSAIARLGREQ